MFRVNDLTNWQHSIRFIFGSLGGAAMILVRHGQSEFNVVYSKTRVDPGIPDPRLTEEGRRQALLAAERLAGRELTLILSSPYTRALQTAQIIAGELDLPIAIEPMV